MYLKMYGKTSIMKTIGKKYCTGSLNISVFPIHFSNSWQCNLHTEHSGYLVCLSSSLPKQAFHSYSHCESFLKLPGYNTQLSDFTRQPIRCRTKKARLGFGLLEFSYPLQSNFFKLIFNFCSIDL